MGAPSSLWTDLLQRLVDAKLAGTKLPEGGYKFRSNEQAAELALCVFQAYAMGRSDGHAEDHA